jgi:hypothetical protein
MTTLEHLLADEAQLMLQMQELKELLSCIHIRMAKMRNVNRNAITYGLSHETLSAIFEAGLSQTSYPPPHSWLDSKAQIPFQILISSVSRR